MQAKLHRWAGEDPSRCFGDLFNLVYDPAFLVGAFERVAANAGAKTAGIDGVTVAQIKAREGGELEFLAQLRDSLKSGGYRPVEVRQVMIPKGKSGKFRKLGIPTVTDRVVQASLKAVLEPIFEADFKPCSYGFRPNRRSQDAIAEIHQLSSGRSDYRLFEVNRDRVAVRLPIATSLWLLVVSAVVYPWYRRCGRACAGLPCCGTRMPGGLRAWRAGSGSRKRNS